MKEHEVKDLVNDFLTVGGTPLLVEIYLRGTKRGILDEKDVPLVVSDNGIYVLCLESMNKGIGKRYQLSTQEDFNAASALEKDIWRRCLK